MIVFLTHASIGVLKDFLKWCCKRILLTDNKISYIYWHVIVVMPVLTDRPTNFCTPKPNLGTVLCATIISIHFRTEILLGYLYACLLL